MFHLRFVPPTWRGALALLALAPAAAPALAQLASPVEVRLVAPGGSVGNPTPLLLTQSLSTGGPILAGGSGAISGSMLPLERIALSGSSLLLRVAQGDSAGGTGLLGLGGSPARYEFIDLPASGLYLSGFSAYSFDGYATSGFNGLLSGLGVSLQDSNADGFADRLQFNLSSLVFTPRGLGESNNFAEVRIDLQTAPVPEPASLALLLGGLLVLGARWARQPRGAAS